MERTRALVACIHSHTVSGHVTARNTITIHASPCLEHAKDSLQVKCAVFAAFLIFLNASRYRFVGTESACMRSLCGIQVEEEAEEGISMGNAGEVGAQECLQGS